MEEKDPLEGATEEERKGVEAIQYLLDLDDRSEPAESSLATWRRLSVGEKVITLSFFKELKKGEKKDGL